MLDTAARNQTLNFTVHYLKKKKNQIKAYISLNQHGIRRRMKTDVIAKIKYNIYAKLNQKERHAILALNRCTRRDKKCLLP